MVDHKSILIWHGLTTKVIPLIFVAIGFLFVFTMTRPFVAWLSPVNVFYAYLFWISGVVFFYEMGMSIPETIRGTGSKIGAMLLGAIGGVSFLYGFMTFFGLYDVTHDTGFANLVLTVLMILQMGLFLAQGWEEIVHYRRFKMNKLVL